VLVDDRDDVQAGCQIAQRGNGPQVDDAPFLLWLRDAAPVALLGHCGDDVFETSEVFLPHDFGLAVHPFALTDVVVGPSVDLLLGEAGHVLDHT
jgi:hypothetical protein